MKVNENREPWYLKIKKFRVAGCTCAYFNTIETLKHVFLKKTFANTTIVLQVSTIISFYQLRPAYQLRPTTRYSCKHKKWIQETVRLSFWFPLRISKSQLSFQVSLECLKVLVACSQTNTQLSFLIGGMLMLFLSQIHSLVFLQEVC